MSFDATSELGNALERERALFQRYEELRKVAAQLRVILAHDIKTQFAVINGAADLLSKDIGRLTEERSTKLLGALVASVNQIQSMISGGEAAAVAAALKPGVVDLVAAARKVSDVDIEGKGEISTYHPALAESLLQHLLAPAERLHLTNDGDWVVLTISGPRGADRAITGHLIEMLGGKLEDARVLLPRQPH